jgi:TRAP-type mannitol/chloroaromatic compound transport system permease small subunit
MSSESTVIKQSTAHTPNWLFDRITYGLLVLAGSCSVLMALFVTYGVIRRYFFRNPDDNVYLLIYILMLSCAMLSFAHTQKMGAHITVDFVSGRLPPLARGIILNVVGPLMGLFFCGCIVWMSWNNAMFSFSSGETTVLNTHVAAWPMKVVVPFGAGLMCLVLLVQMLRFFFSLRSSSSKAA